MEIPYEGVFDWEGLGSNGPPKVSTQHPIQRFRDNKMLIPEKLSHGFSLRLHDLSMKDRQHRLRI
jgi:hypothetical protein